MLKDLNEEKVLSLEEINAVGEMLEIKQGKCKGFEVKVEFQGKVYGISLKEL